jgi:S-adenosylmethionine decarboxylase
LSEARTEEFVLHGHLQRHGDTHYIGTHLLLDMWEAAHLDDPEFVLRALRECAMACNATLINSHVHHFGERAGVTGVVLLAESHISVHTWPEHSYAAFDVFVCGSLNPYAAAYYLIQRFNPESRNLIEHKRGLMLGAAHTALRVKER